MVKFHRAIHARSVAVPSFAVATLTGGVGKTTATRIIDFTWSDAGQPLKAVSIDSVDDKRASKLLKLIDGAQQVEIEAADTDIARAGKDTDAQLDHWNRIGEMLVDGGHLFDFGANAVHRFINWARKAQPRDLLDDAPVLNLVVPTTANPQAAADALWTLKQFREVEPVFMKIRPVVVFNGLFGLVDKAVASEVAELRSYVEDNHIPVVVIANGTIGVAERFTFMELATARPREFAGKLGVTPMSANTTLKLFSTWLAEAAVSFKAAGLGPVKASQPADEVGGQGVLDEVSAEA